MLRKTVIAAALALGLSTSSCLGPNHAFNKLNNWNSTATNHEWMNEVIFLALNVVPVYSLAYIGDVLIFNTIDYWGGDNPVGEPGEFNPEWGKD